MTIQQLQQRIQETAEALYADYAAANPSMAPREIRELCRREAIYLVDERDAIQREGAR